jgi:hypothetical protein
MKHLPALICIRRVYLFNNACKHLILFLSTYADNTECTVGDRKLSTLWLVVISFFKNETGKMVMNGEQARIFTDASPCAIRTVTSGD